MRRQRGFTLIELLVVIAIIAILATLVITQLAGAQTKARNSNAKSDISQAGKAIETWKIDNSSDKVPNAETVGTAANNNAVTKLNFTTADPGWTALFQTASAFPIQLQRTPNASYIYGYSTQTFNAAGTVATMSIVQANNYCIATNVVSGNNVSDKGFAVRNGNSKTLAAKDVVFTNGDCS